VWVASLKGHGQFAGRLVEIFFGRNLKAMTVARIAIGILPAALLLLMLAQGSLVQLVVFTCAAGRIAGRHHDRRGALPLALFGAKGYGAVLGLIATPILFVNAFSPAVFAFIVDQIGWHSAVYALLASSLLTWIAIELMSRWYEGARTARASTEQAAPTGPRLVSLIAAGRLVALVCTAQVFVQLGAGYWPVLMPDLMKPLVAQQQRGRLDHLGVLRHLHGLGAGAGDAHRPRRSQARLPVRRRLHDGGALRLRLAGRRLLVGAAACAAWPASAGPAPT
jgi:hypothetical protein